MEDTIEILSPEEQLDPALATLLAICNGQPSRGMLEAIRRHADFVQELWEAYKLGELMPGPPETLG